MYLASVRGEESDICHDSDHHVLLEIELPGVETPRVTEGGELPGREDRFQEFSSRECEQLSDICRDRNTGLTNTEELIDKTSVKQLISKCTLMYKTRVGGCVVVVNIPGRNEDRSNKPSTEGTRWYRGVIVVINHSTNLGVRRILAKRR